MTEQEKERSEFFYPDGRINPDKAFTFIQEKMKTLSREDFIRFATTPVKVKNDPLSLYGGRRET